MPYVIRTKATHSPKQYPAWISAVKNKFSVTMRSNEALQFARREDAVMAKECFEEVLQLAYGSTVVEEV